MSAIAVQTPFPIFNDIDGQPLEAGYIFVGVADLDPQGNPVAVFFDEALTQPAGQPIRTIGGYPANSGTPTNLYSGSDYSIRVTNKNGSVIYSAPVAQNYLALPLDLAAASGSSLVGFIQTGSEAVATTSQAKLRESISATDMGASPSASAGTNVAAILAASQEFPEDTVQRGAFSFQPGEQYNVNAEILLNRKSLTIDGKNAALKWSGTNASQSIFRVTDSSRVKFKDLVLLGDITNPPYAAIRFFRNASGDTTGTNENCSVENTVIGRKFTANTTTGGSADATPYAKFQRGIAIDGSDGNNDEYHIKDTQVHSCSVVGIDFANAQSIFTSLSSLLLNDNEIGIRAGCDLTGYNLTFNRNRVADITGIRALTFRIFGMFAENSLIFANSTAGASFQIIGGKMLRNNATPSNFFRTSSGGNMILEKLLVLNVGGTGDTIFYRAGSDFGGSLKVRDCSIAGGDLRNTWDVSTMTTGPVVVIDIDHGRFRFKTDRGYLDVNIVPIAAAAAASVLVSTASINTPLGTPFNLSYQFDMQGQHLTISNDSATVTRGRIFNVTAAPITLAAGRFRWLDLTDYASSGASAILDFASRSNNIGQSLTINLPGANLGDYIAFGTSQSFANEVVTAYVSATNTVTVRSHNATGGTSNPAATTFNVFKIKEFGNFQNTLAYTPAAIGNAETVNLTVSVIGAQLGGHTFVAYSADLAGLICTAHVSSNDVVSIVITNYTGTAITLGAGYFKVMVAF